MLWLWCCPVCGLRLCRFQPSSSLAPTSSFGGVNFGQGSGSRKAQRVSEPTLRSLNAGQSHKFQNMLKTSPMLDKRICPNKIQNDFWHMTESLPYRETRERYSTGCHLQQSRSRRRTCSLHSQCTGHHPPIGKQVCGTHHHSRHSMGTQHPSSAANIAGSVSPPSSAIYPTASSKEIVHEGELLAYSWQYGSPHTNLSWPGPPSTGLTKSMDLCIYIYLNCHAGFLHAESRQGKTNNGPVLYKVAPIFVQFIERDRDPMNRHLRMTAPHPKTNWEIHSNR